MSSTAPGAAPTAPTPFQAGPGSKGIHIKSWSITSTKLPILNAQESDTATAALVYLPLPEICFGNNRLVVHDATTGLKLEWDTLRALRAVGRTTPVKVAYADAWARGQANSGSADVAVQKPFDWTYTTVHPGTVSSPSHPDLDFVPAPAGHPGIPLHLLARQDIPILFFDEIPLFEDELGDNGIAEVVVRVRVNSTSVFVLSRFFLRVDDVLFRTFDVRLYHAFGSGEIIRELKGRQAAYDDVKRRLPADRPNDLTLLTDVNWVCAQLEALASSSPSSSASPSPVSGSSSPARLPSRVAAAPVDRAMGRLNLGEASSPSTTPSLPPSGTRSKLPDWEAEGVRLQVLALPPVNGEVA